MQLLIQAEIKGILSPPMASTIKAKNQRTRSQSFGRAGSPGLQALTCYEGGWRGKRCRWVLCSSGRNTSKFKNLYGRPLVNRILPVAAFTDGFRPFVK